MEKDNVRELSTERIEDVAGSLDHRIKEKEVKEE